MKTITTEVEMPKPQFADIKFKNDAEFQKWLKKMAWVSIEFVDTGRDMYKIWIHETGEILHSNAQGGVWIGKFVALNQIVEGMHVCMTLDHEWKQMKGLIVEQIKKIK